MLRGLQVHRRTLGGLAAGVVAATAIVVTVASGPATAAESVNTPVTYQGSTYPSNVNAATKDKPQSKLWYKDGSWWGMLLSTTKGTHTIHELMSDHTWRDTGVETDSRPTSTGDALLSGDTLYVASRSSSGSVRVRSFSYDAGGRTWSAADSTKTLARSGARSMTVALDTAGRLWATYTSGTTVYVASAPASTFSWSTPIPVPSSDATISSDDISGIIAFDGKVGILWSDQQSNAMRFAVHVDGEATGDWTMETIYDDPGSADNHINIKTLLDDAQGRVFAAVKTSYDTIGEPSTAPIIRVLKRSSDGTWTVASGGTIADKLTRPQIALDQQHNRLYLLMTGPTSGGTIYYKTSSLDALSFSGGRGDVFMSWPGAELNDVSTMKDVVSSTTGLVAVASDSDAHRYYHAELSLDEGSTPTTTTTTTTTTTPPPTTSTTTSTTTTTTTSTTTTTTSSTTTTTPPSSGVAFRAASTAQVGSGTSLVVAKPPGLVAGDVLVATVSSRGKPRIAAPAGWTLVDSTTNGNVMRQNVYRRVAGASEPTSWTFTLHKAKPAVVQVAAYSGVSTADPVRAYGASVNASSTTVTAPAVTAVGGDGVVAVFGTARSATLSVTASLTKRTQVESVGGSRSVSGALGDRIAPASGSTGIFTATTPKSAASVGHTLVLAAA